jgi:hypothetical protein
MGGRSTASGIRYSVPLPPLLLSFIGLYFLLSGRSVFRLLMREAPTSVSRGPRKDVEPAASLRRSMQEPADSRTTLTRTEQIEFTAWLRESADLHSRSEDDQLALYRDHQKVGEGHLR